MKFAGCGGFWELLIAIGEFQDLHFEVRARLKWGFNIWWCSNNA
jgi:hypothetical protein